MDIFMEENFYDNIRTCVIVKSKKARDEFFDNLNLRGIKWNSGQEFSKYFYDRKEVFFLFNPGTCGVQGGYVLPDPDQCRILEYRVGCCTSVEFDIDLTNMV